MPLTNLQCQKAKNTDRIQKLFDGQGLYLELPARSGKYWRFKYRYLGKEKRLAFGVYPEVSLQEAREIRWILTNQALQGGIAPTSEWRDWGKIKTRFHQRHRDSTSISRALPHGLTTDTVKGY